MNPYGDDLQNLSKNSITKTPFMSAILLAAAKWRVISENKELMGRESCLNQQRHSRHAKDNMQFRRIAYGSF